MMVRILNKCITIVLMLASSQLFAQNCDPTNDAGLTCLNYAGNDGNERHYLEVYGNGGNTPKPAVIFIHGGGWENQGIDWFDLSDPMLAALANEFVLVNINYRYSSEAIFPAQIHDCKTAIRYLRANAEMLNIDPCNIGVIGVSAGAHLASLLGASNGVDHLEGYHLGSSAYSSDVQAVTAISPVVDILVANDQLAAAGLDCANICNNQLPPDYNDIHSFASQLIGCSVEYCPEEAQAMSPLSYINSNEPPFLIYHGNQDCTVPAEQSQLLYDELEDANPGINEYNLENFCHYGLLKDDDVIAETVDFFNQKLINPQTCETCNDIEAVVSGAYVEHDDNDYDINNSGFSNNPSISFTDTDTPLNANLTNIELELYFRVAGGSCESDMQVLINTPDGGSVQFDNVLSTCNGSGNLYHVFLNVPALQTTSSPNNWTVQFNNSNTQIAGNATTHFLRFTRLTYNYESLSSENDCDGDGVLNDVDIAPADPCVFGESKNLVWEPNLKINDIGFASNPSATLSDSTIPANTPLSNAAMKLFFRVFNNSCEGDIDVQITDPTGNMLSFPAIFGQGNCVGDAVYSTTLNLPDIITTSTTQNWIIQFDDSNGQNPGIECIFGAALFSYEAHLFSIPATNSGDCDGDGVTNADEINGLDGDPTTTADYTNPNDACDLNYSQITLDVVSEMDCPSCDYFTNNNTITLFDDDNYNIFSSDYSTNPAVLLSDPGTPAYAQLFDINFQIYFRVAGASLERDFNVLITDPSGQSYEVTTQFGQDDSGVNGTNTNFPNGQGLYLSSFSLPFAHTSGNSSDWVIRFKDDMLQNNGGLEYSVKFTRLDYDYRLIALDANDCDGDGVNNADEAGNTDPNDPCDFNSNQITLPVIHICDDSNKMAFDNQSFESAEKLNQNNFTIYPNPANQYIKIDTEDKLIHQVQILNSAGISLITSTEKTINIEALTPGLYLVKIFFENDFVFKRLSVIN